jgi:hypothetical protein
MGLFIGLFQRLLSLYIPVFAPLKKNENMRKKIFCITIMVHSYTDTGFKFWHKLLNKAFKLRLSFLNCKMGILSVFRTM